MLMEAGPLDQERVCNYVDIVNFFYQDADSIQLTLAPDQSCCPHGHAYLPGWFIPTEFLKYTNVVKIKRHSMLIWRSTSKLYALKMKT